MLYNINVEESIYGGLCMCVYVNENRTAYVEMTLTGGGYIYEVVKYDFPYNEIVASEVTGYEEAKEICDSVEE